MLLCRSLKRASDGADSITISGTVGELNQASQLPTNKCQHVIYNGAP